MMGHYIYVKFIDIAGFLITLVIFTIPMSILFRELPNLPAKPKWHSYLFTALFLFGITFAVRSLFYMLGYLSEKN